MCLPSCQVQGRQYNRPLLPDSCLLYLSSLETHNLRYKKQREYRTGSSGDVPSPYCYRLLNLYCPRQLLGCTTPKLGEIVLCCREDCPKNKRHLIVEFIRHKNTPTTTDQSWFLLLLSLSNTLNKQLFPLLFSETNRDLVPILLTLFLTASASFWALVLMAEAASLCFWAMASNSTASSSS